MPPQPAHTFYARPIVTQNKTSYLLLPTSYLANTSYFLPHSVQLDVGDVEPEASYGQKTY